MRVILAVLIAFAAVALASAFLHHPEGHFEEEEHSYYNETHYDHWGSKESGEDKKRHHHHHHHKKDWQCKGKPINKNEEQIIANKECKEEFHEAKIQNVEGRQKGMTCKSICAGKKIGFFDSDDQIVQSKLDALVESTITSTEGLKLIKEKTAACAHKFSTELENGPSDEKCSNYKPYLKCLWISVMQVCNPQFDSEDWE